MAIYKDTDCVINTVYPYHFFPCQFHLCVTTTKSVFSKPLLITLPLPTVLACVFSLLFVLFSNLLLVSCSWDLALEFYLHIPFQIKKKTSDLENVFISRELHCFQGVRLLDVWVWAEQKIVSCSKCIGLCVARPSVFCSVIFCSTILKSSFWS